MQVGSQTRLHFAPAPEGDAHVQSSGAVALLSPPEGSTALVQSLCAPAGGAEPSSATFAHLGISAASHAACHIQQQKPPVLPKP